MFSCTFYAQVYDFRIIKIYAKQANNFIAIGTEDCRLAKLVQIYGKYS